jgi:uncharacterized protein
MTKGRRVLLFAITFLLLLPVFYFTNGRLFPRDDISVVLFSSLVMLSLVTFFLEHFFTTPTDVLASTISILLILSPLHDKLLRFGKWYWLFFGYNLLLLLTSLIALLLADADQSAMVLRNRISSQLKRFSTFFGNGRFLFFMLFFLTLVFFIDSHSSQFLVLAGYASAILLIDPKRFFLVGLKSEGKKGNDIGEIFGVQSKNTFLAKLYTKRVPVRRFELVEFRYSMDESKKICKGMIVDNYLLNEQQWIKILCADEVHALLSEDAQNQIEGDNVVYKLTGQNAPEFLNRFVGVVIEHSNIEKLRFEYGGRVPVSEGNLLSLKIGGKTVLYQVIQGLTEIETLESKNEAGVIVGEAIQLGIWNCERLTFEKFGWVPDVNTPVLLAARIEVVTPPEGEVQIGAIPDTNYPVLLNLENTVTHHLGILGVTGSGKSVFCRKLLREIVVSGTKIICVDFTNEYKDKFSDLNPVPIVTEAHKEEMFKAIDDLSTELEKFKNQQNQQLIKEKTKLLDDRFYENISNFLKSEKPLSIFELPDVSNTTGILEYTKWFFRGLFRIAREHKNYGKNVCIVLEEAHTVIPEWNFIGVEEKKAQSLVNSIGQIALQGRKYHIGFIVIAQRTANVSKTVLTQCNSILAFQQFDKTSADFLTNYMGTEMVSTLPSLKFRQAIAVGKGFRSGVPMIFEVPEIIEGS